MTWQNDVNKTCRRVGRDLPTIDLGSRRELFVDDYLIDRMDGVRLRFAMKDADLYAFRFRDQ